MTTPVLQKEPIEARFRRFHELNPHVYDALVQVAREAKQRGAHKLGIGMLYEILRWRHIIETDDPSSSYELPNDYRSRYARLIMEREPDLEGIFNTQKLRAE